MVKVKLQASKELNNGDLQGVSNMLVFWGNQLSATQANQIKILDCDEWARYSQLYKEFCIQGVKMEYKPY